MKKLRFALAVFVKTPGLSPIKTRLAKSIGESQALKVYQKCLEMTQLKIDQLVTDSSHTLVPYWAVAEKDGLTSAHWSSWNRIYQGEGELGDRLSRVYDELLSQFDGVILMGADSPMFPSAEVNDGIAWLANNEFGVLVGPTLDGGYYVFGFRKPVPRSIWTSVPYSTSTTLVSFLDLLPSQIEKNFLSKHWDVDTQDDLRRLVREAPDFMEGT